MPLLTIARSYFVYKSLTNLKHSRELKRLTGNPFTKMLSTISLWFKGIATFMMLLMAILFCSLTVDEFKASSLTLPNVDNVDIPVKMDVEKQMDNLMSSLLSNDIDARTFDVPKIADDDFLPVYTEIREPATVETTEQLGKAIAHHLSNFDKSFTIDYTGYTNDFEKTFTKATEWVARNYPYYDRMQRSYTYTYMDYGDDVEVEVNTKYRLTPEKNALVQGKIERIIVAVPKDATDLEKVKFVNDYIVRHTKYNLKSKESPYTPYAVLFDGEGVCEGYALTALLMLQSLDIDVKYIMGDTDGGLHAWNLVKIDGQWKHLDTTWNDPVPDQGNSVRYDYFLVSPKKMARDHYWDENTYPEGSDMTN